MKTRSFRSLSILCSSASPSSRLSEESKRNSKASPNPFPVYRYSSSLEKRVELMEVVRRKAAPVARVAAGEADLNGEGDLDIAGTSSPLIGRERPEAAK
jgi:hypothetical protein